MTVENGGAWEGNRVVRGKRSMLTEAEADHGELGWKRQGLVAGQTDGNRV